MSSEPIVTSRRSDLYGLALILPVFVDDQLSGSHGHWLLWLFLFFVLLLEGFGTEIAQRGMPSLSVRLDFDPPEDRPLALPLSGTGFGKRILF